jgi:hypothetical protein
MSRESMVQVLGVVGGAASVVLRGLATSQVAAATVFVTVLAVAHLFSI